MTFMGGYDLRFLDDDTRASSNTLPDNKFLTMDGVPDTSTARRQYFSVFLLAIIILDDVTRKHLTKGAMDTRLISFSFFPLNKLFYQNLGFIV